MGGAVGEHAMSLLLQEIIERHPLPWAYRPEKHDDWGFVRDARGGLVLSTCPSGLAADFSKANLDYNETRKAGPQQARFLAELLIDVVAHAARVLAQNGGPLREQQTVSCELFTGVLELLVKKHGNRRMGPAMNCLHPKLARDRSCVFVVARG